MAANWATCEICGQNGPRSIIVGDVHHDRQGSWCNARPWPRDQIKADAALILSEITYLLYCHERAGGLDERGRNELTTYWARFGQITRGLDLSSFVNDLSLLVNTALTKKGAKIP